MNISVKQLILTFNDFLTSNKHWLYLIDQYDNIKKS